MRTPILLPALLLASLSATPAHAAQSYDNCTGFIDSLPAVISTQGTWCMRSDLSTAISNGSAIQITTNNVTIDCNDFKLGGLAAGITTDAYGISAQSRTGLTVRNCRVRGFWGGIMLDGAEGGGHLVERNLVEFSTTFGILTGPQSVVRDNIIKDTGGGVTATHFAIYSSGGVVQDNVVEGVLSESNFLDAFGIFALNPAIIRDNAVRDVAAPNDSQATGIRLGNSNSVIRDNDVTATGTPMEFGIACNNATTTARGNTIVNATNAITTCASSGNDINPN